MLKRRIHFSPISIPGKLCFVGIETCSKKVDINSEPFILSAKHSKITSSRSSIQCHYCYSCLSLLHYLQRINLFNLTMGDFLLMINSTFSGIMSTAVTLLCCAKSTDIDKPT